MSQDSENQEHTAPDHGKVTQASVFAAADELNSQGKNPTLTAIRKILGKGSFTTITEHLSIWKAQKASKAPPLREIPPEAISDAAHLFASEIWGNAIKLANARLDADREALDKLRTEINTQLRDAIELADQISDDLGKEKERCAALERELLEGRDFLNQSRHEVNIMSARLEEVKEGSARMSRFVDATQAQNIILIETIKKLSGGKLPEDIASMIKGSEKLQEPISSN